MSEIAPRLQEFLDSHHAVYKEHKLSELNDSESFSLDQAVKALLFSTDSGFVLTVLALSHRVNSKKLRRYLRSQKLHLATENELVSTMDCVPGSCHPFGSVNGVSTIADRQIRNTDTIFFSSGWPNVVLEMYTCDYLDLENPTNEDIV